jgi:cytoskeletal protein CcmA (bactofilin family)
MPSPRRDRTDMVIETDEITALLGPGTEFAGKLIFRGTVRIDGKFNGEIISNDILIIGEGAEIQAQIQAGTVIVKGGTIVGDITATELVEIHSPGKLKGNITAKSLYIDKGVVFEGECKMAMPPAGQPSPPPVPKEMKKL